MYIPNRIFKLRWEVFLFHTLVLCFSFSFELFLPQNFFLLSSNEIFLILVFYFSISFFLSIGIEIFYFFLKLFSTILLRLGVLWKYAIPSVLVFLLIFIPLFELTDFRDVFYNFKGIQGNIYIVSFGLSLILFIILILIFPIFYGLNGGFIILSCLLSYSLLRLFANFLAIEFSFWEYLLLYYSFTLLFFLLLQARRRYALSVSYENFPYPSWLIMIFFFIFLLFTFARIHNSKDLYSFILLTIFIYLILNINILSFLLNIEAKLNFRIFNLNFHVIFFMFIFNFFLVYLYFQFWNFPSFHKLEKTDKVWAFYFFTAIHFLGDTDKDGENNFFGKDIENYNPKKRKEGVVKEKEAIQLPELTIPSNYVWITIYFENYTNEPKDYYYTSDDIKKTLFSLIFNSSSFETIHYFNSNKNDLKIKSIFSYLTENYFRTICIGYLNTSSYFIANSESKIDKGCEILINLEAIKGAQSKNDVESMIEASRYYIQSYKDKKNFIWLHTHLFSLNGEIQKEKIVSLLMNSSIAEFYYPYKRILFLFFDKPIHHYEVYSDIENKEVVLNPNFSYFGTLYRLLLYNELNKSKKDFFKEEFFLREYNFTLSKTLDHYIFFEPKDIYWDDLKKIFGKPHIPPISFDIEKKVFYDGRWGITSN